MWCRCDKVQEQVTATKHLSGRPSTQKYSVHSICKRFRRDISNMKDVHGKKRELDMVMQ